MKLNHVKQDTVNTCIDTTNYEYLQEKPQDGLLQLSMSLGIEEMRMMLEEDVVQYAGPKGKHNTTGRICIRLGLEQTTVVRGG